MTSPPPSGEHGERGGRPRLWDRIALIRWFKSSLPGRISAVFLLAAIVTVAGLLYVTPRLESSLIEPREQSVKQTLALGLAAAPVLAYATGEGGVPAQPTDYPTVLQSVFGFGLFRNGQSRGLGSSAQRVVLYELTGDPKRPSMRDLSPDVQERASSIARRAAVSRRRIEGITSVGGVPRIEAARRFNINAAQPDGSFRNYRLVLSVWQDVDDVQRTVEIARQRIIVAGIGGASIALILGVWVTTRLTRRIRALEAGARKVARGDFTAQFRGEGSLELARLARALDEMQRQLAELETARRRFIATASHELRTPLSTLQGFLELLEDQNLDPERRHEFVMHASQQAQRLSKLASDLLDLSRLDVGSVTVKRAPVDVGLLLEGLLTEFRVAGANHASLLRREIDPRAETALVDGDRVLQLLRALVNNALTHTPAGTNITVGARRRGSRVEFTVADDGPGIPAELIRDIFEAFVTSDETRGSGLGLAIGRELARRMQGDLTVASEPGSTVFTLSLPA
ncbi:MAG: HAMP domain-containing histidine kinase [Solirubrobacteraceae bacterium]|nr:HAMP domain-containing histidine kinase [Solirubrobacteraceae bacterium]